MNLIDAKAECERWLAHLDRQKQKSIDLQHLGAERRAGRLTGMEAKRRLRELDNRSSLTVYDGAKLADAVRLLLKSTYAE